MILSPGVIGATANHTCECLGVMINSAYNNHGDLPSLLSVQFDGASTNKNMLVLAYLGLYALEGVFAQVRVRCLLENHAHDVYDAFHATHAARVKHSTFYNLEELRGIIRGAHDRLSSGHVLRPLVGHDVQISELWELRDFWEWLAPGYSQKGNREYALESAAFVSYSGISKYRDFRLELEEVGLWAKAYMTTDEYQYLGTLLSDASLAGVVGKRQPELQHRVVSEQKRTRESTVLEKLQKATRGPFREQFSEQRMSDAIAMCKRQWDHFKESPGKLQPADVLLPSELAARMKQDGRRQSVPSVQSTQSLQSMQSLRSQRLPGHGGEQTSADKLLDDEVKQVPAIRQRAHNAKDLYGLSSNGPNVAAMPSSGGRAPPAASFLNRRVSRGSFVMTRPAPSGHWAKANPRLTESDFWVWRVIKLWPPGSAIPGFPNKKTDTFTYEAHLFHQTDGEGRRATWVQSFTDERPVFMRTPEEKDERKRKKEDKKTRRRARGVGGGKTRKNKYKALKQRKKPGDDEADECLTPVRCYLRPQNVIGGSFNLTSTKKVPSYVQDYFVQHAQ